MQPKISVQNEFRSTKKSHIHIMYVQLLEKTTFKIFLANFITGLSRAARKPFEINTSQTSQCRFQLFVGHMLDKKDRSRTVRIYQGVPLGLQYLRKKKGGKKSVVEWPLSPCSVPVARYRDKGLFFSLQRRNTKSSTAKVLIPSKAV